MLPKKQLSPAVHGLAAPTITRRLHRSFPGKKTTSDTAILRKASKSLYRVRMNMRPKATPPSRTNDTTRRWLTFSSRSPATARRQRTTGEGTTPRGLLLAPANTRGTSQTRRKKVSPSHRSACVCHTERRPWLAPFPQPFWYTPAVGHVHASSGTLRSCDRGSATQRPAPSRPQTHSQAGKATYTAKKKKTVNTAFLRFLNMHTTGATPTQQKPDSPTITQQSVEASQASPPRIGTSV